MNFKRLSALLLSFVFGLTVIAQPTTAQTRPRVVIADYMLWYQPDVFDGKKTFDVPASGGYNSDELGIIQRQVALAQQACLDGFSPHWYGPQEPRTTNNINQLFAASAGTNLRHAVVILNNSLPRSSEQSLIDSVKFILGNWANHPNYLRIDGKPVIIFTDMQRPWNNNARALAGWKRIRDAADPGRTALWMAEGYSTMFNPLFDGLYVYRVDHRTAPGAWAKQPSVASALRQVQESSGQKLYFADTVAAGFDDTRSRRLKGDVRVPAPTFARNRRNGQYMRDTFSVTDKTNSDFMIVKSFNEWVEGSAIEPSKGSGDLYMKVTCELANAYRAR